MGAEGARFSCPGSSVVGKFEAEAARFENPEVLETIGPDLVSSFRSQSLTEESEASEEPAKPDQAR
jgi:hypothetical protein